MTTKKTAIVALVCVNVVLLACVGHAAITTAQGQTMRGASNYLLLTGQVENNYDVAYVIDLSTRKLLTLKFDRTTKRLVPFGVRSLTRDFR